MIKTRTTMIATELEDIENLLNNADSLIKHYKAIKLNCIVVRHYKGLNSENMREEKLYTIYNEDGYIKNCIRLKEYVLNDIVGYYDTKVVFNLDYSILD